MSNETILVVDDEPDILDLLEFSLKNEGYNPICVETGEDALKVIKSTPLDLIVLDLMLPGIDGLNVAGILKSEEETRDIPIVMVTAKGEEQDIIKGLELGADDYITKPFSPKVLLARILATLRARNTAKVEEKEDSIQFNDIVIYPERRLIVVKGEQIDLTYTEFQILMYLSHKPGWVYSRSQIVDGVRGDNYPVTDRSVDVQIVGLRKKLGECGKYIETVRGVGYRFVVPK